MKNVTELELILFESSAQGARRSQSFGITKFMLDWEQFGKTERQSDFDTEIKPVGVVELASVAAVPGALAWCRINSYSPNTQKEIELAIDAGTHGVFLPMVTHPQQVEHFLRLLDGRCASGILIETEAALTCAKDIAMLPLERIYFGLNDFAISRRERCIFLALLDGSLERAREAFVGKSFGFGGVTAIDSGHPIPCARLIEEMARLDCQFSFLRRSFRRDVERIGGAALIENVQSHWERCRARSEAAVRSDRHALEQLLREICRDA